VKGQFDGPPKVVEHAFAAGVRACVSDSDMSLDTMCGLRTAFLRGPRHLTPICRKEARAHITADAALDRQLILWIYK
jgi:hypothetical protein